MTRPTRRVTIALCALLVSGVSATSASAQPTIVVQWNEATLEAVRNVRFAPTLTARALAIVHTCMYDAWAAYDPVAVGTVYGGALRRPPQEHTAAARERALSHAAYRALVDLFPAQQAGVFDPKMNALGFDPLDSSTDVTTPAGIGNVACAGVLARRHADGSNQLGDLHPGAYSDYTGYAPVNDPQHLNDPNRWQPLRDSLGVAQRFLTPHWGLVEPFAFRPSGELRPAPPPLFPSGLYRKEANQVLHLSAGLNDRTKTIAAYWADGPATETPPGHWALFAQFVSARDHHTIDEDVKLFFALGNALLDASIAVWECKRFFDYIRPVGAIRFLYQSKPIRAWAGPFQGTQLIRGDRFQSYLPTPPFAEYVSGHSTFSAAAAEILRSFTGSDRFGASIVIPPGWSFVEPGVVPASEVVLTWATFSDAADEAGISRRYGGIHFESGDLQARALGRRVGAVVWDKARSYFAPPADESAATSR